MTLWLVHLTILIYIFVLTRCYDAVQHLWLHLVSFKLEVILLIGLLVKEPISNPVSQVFLDFLLKAEAALEVRFFYFLEQFQVFFALNLHLQVLIIQLLLLTLIAPLLVLKLFDVASHAADLGLLLLYSICKLEDVNEILQENLVVQD